MVVWLEYHAKAIELAPDENLIVVAENVAEPPTFPKYRTSPRITLKSSEYVPDADLLNI